MPKNFNDEPVKLAGQNIVEASAGTGKTYSITGIFLRLLVEKKIPVEKILAVTFTKAATAELKAKIRARITEAVEYIDEGKSGDADLDRLKNFYAPNTSAACGLLKRALLDFDEASVYTIHSFCGRMLKENAFESGVRFDSEIVDSDSKITEQIAEDFWREHIAGGDEFLLKYLISKKVTIKTFKDLVKKKIQFPEIEILPKAENTDLSELLGEITEKAKGLRNSWEKNRNDILPIFAMKDVLNQTSYKPEMLDKMTAMMDEFQPEKFDPAVVNENTFRNFTQPFIKKSTKNKKPVPKHPFFEACEKFKDYINETLPVAYITVCNIITETTDFARKEISERRRIRTSSDLISDLDEAIASEKTGARLIAAIRNKFDAALIDEFQDTDPRQWNIFRKLFLEGDKLLFLIGDPKQSIYKFRGAEVNSYLNAAYSVSEDNKYTLLYNYRSSEKLIKGVNAVFDTENPFRTDKIKFLPSDYPKKKKEERLEIEGEDGNENVPFRLWFIDKNGDGSAVNKGDMKAICENAVAGGIARLLRLNDEGKLKYTEYNNDTREETPITFGAGKIAVLVKTTMQGRGIIDALRRNNIPAVMVDRASVYSSAEAKSIETVIAAAGEPKNLGYVKAALATGLVGKNAIEIDALVNKEGELEKELVRYHDYHDAWEKHGFFFMFRKFIDENNSVEKLLQYTDGERRVTNLLQLSELLHKESVDSALTQDGLLKYLRGKMAEESSDSEDAEMRKESDENAVQVVTVHKSKGLQYPVVFCPNLWHVATGGNKNPVPVFHDEDGRLKMYLGREKIDSYEQKSMNENLEEELRLMYVALTRAKSRCYMMWGYINDTMDSAPFYLFHNKQYNAAPSDDIAAYDLKAALKERFAEYGDSVFIGEAPAYEEYKPSAKAEVELSVKPVSRMLGKPDFIHSFSEMKSGGHPLNNTDDPADRDESYEEEPQISDEKNAVQTMKGGSSTGNCLHSIFEHISFKKGADNQEIISEWLQRYRLEKYESAVKTIIRNALFTSIPAGDEEISLSDIRGSDRLHETEFYFPVKPGVKKILRAALNGTDNTSEDETEISDNDKISLRGGYINGIIDLIFRHNGKYYILDWKSNKVGKSSASYTKEKLKEKMYKEGFNMQLAIYTVALDLYLGKMLENYTYDKNFGGVIYLFLRGVSAGDDSGRGIYFEKPDEKKLAELKSRILR